MMAIVKNKLVLFLGAALVAALALGGCVGSPAPDVDSEQALNRAYMSQVNEIMADLDGSLEPFVEAVSSGELVSIRNEANAMGRILDKLSALEAPEDLVDIQKGYDEGTADLRRFLDEYLALYDEVQAGTFDWATYDSRREAIQELYDKGVEAIQEADADLAEL